MTAQSPRSLALVVWPLVALFATGAVLVAWLVIDDYRRGAAAAARTESAQLVRSAEASVNRSLIGVDLLLAGLDRIPGVLRPARDAIDSTRATEMLRAISEQNLAVIGLMVLDEQCGVLAASEESALRIGPELPAGFCEAAFRQAASQMSISEPASSFATGEKVLYLARPAPLADGTRVLAVATLPLSQLATELSQSVESQDRSVTLERDDGLLLASMPANSPLVGTRLEPPLNVALATGRATLMRSRLGNAMAFVTVRPTVYRSMFIAAGLSEASAMQRIEGQSKLIALAAGAFVLLSILAGALIQAYLRAGQRATDEVNAAKAVLDQALEAMADCFLLCDADDRVVTWNSRYLEAFPHLRPVIAPGVPFQALAEVAARVLKADATEAERRRWLEERIAAHLQGNRIFEQTLPDGRIIHGLERRTRAGGIVSVLRDVTPERASATELVRARAAAEAANEAKSRFLATMSHEIRTPLDGVLSLSGLLLDTPLSEQQRRYAETVRDCGETLLNVINDILDFSRLEAGRVTLVLAPFRPAPLIAEVAKLLGAGARAKGIALDTDLAPDLPEWLEGDPDRLRQVLYNLIGNAVKFTSEGGVTIGARHRDLTGELVELDIEVRDTGIGIPADALDTLFERFSQAEDATARRFGGSGLGLAISRELVELMGGSICAESRPDEGSVFRFKLPLKRAQAPIRPAGVALQVVTGRAPGMRVLVAEDNSVNRLLVRTLLERLGHTVDIVGDGHEAIERIQAAPYDLVLMDIEMPGMAGEAAARTIRTLPGPVSQVPIVALTAYATAEHREKYLAAGMDDHITKPIDSARLEQVLAQVARMRRRVAS